MTDQYEAAAPTPQRVSRWGLYLPTAALLVIAVVWSGFWWTAARATSSALDGWLSAEAAAGRRWSCVDRSWGGYPFRLEFRCDDAQVVTLADGVESRATLKGLTLVSQVYNPKLILANFAAPLTVQQGEQKITVKWDDLHASLRRNGGDLQRLSFVSKAPHATLQFTDGAEELNARSAELHVRTDTERARAEKAIDVALRAEDASIPALDRITTSDATATLDVSGVVTQSNLLRGGNWKRSLATWRVADGRLDIVAATLDKGQIHAQASGELQIDDENRPQGRLTVSATGAGDTLARLGVSAGGGVQKALDGLFGKRAGSVLDAAASMRWPVRLENGSVYVGPVRTPVVLKRLY